MYPRLQISTFRVYQLWRRIDNDGEMKRLTPIVKFYSILNVMISKTNHQSPNLQSPNHKSPPCEGEASQKAEVFPVCVGLLQPIIAEDKLGYRFLICLGNTALDRWDQREGGESEGRQPDILGCPYFLAKVQNVILN